MGEGRGMCTARPGWQTISPQNMSYKSRMFPVKINLVDILEIDTERKTVRCEPLVSMGQLTATLDNLGWTIPIGIKIFHHNIDISFKSYVSSSRA